METQIHCMLLCIHCCLHWLHKLDFNKARKWFSKQRLITRPKSIFQTMQFNCHAFKEQINYCLNAKHVCKFSGTIIIYNGWWWIEVIVYFTDKGSSMVCIELQFLHNLYYLYYNRLATIANLYYHHQLGSWSGCYCSWYII